MGERIERYLDGDRDLERRRRVAAEYLAQARAAAVRGKHEPEQHAEAIRLAGRAVGLDPESEAVALVASLLLEPPAQDPPPLVAKLEAYDRRVSLQAVRIAATLYFGGFAIALPMFWWVGVKDWSVIGWVVAFGLVPAIGGFVQVALRRTHDIFTLVIVFAFCVAASRFAGPYMVGPALISAALINLGQQVTFVNRRWLLVALTLGTFYLPIALEQVGVFAETVAVHGDGLLVRSSGLDLGNGARVQVLFCFAYTVILVAGGMLATTVARERRTAQRESMRRAWHLENLLPSRESRASA